MKFGCLALLLLALSGIASAQSIEAEGVAVMDAGGSDKARQLALQDALYQAALSASAQVEGSSAINAAGELRENLRISTAARVASHTIVREWVNNGMFHVLVRAEIQNEAPADQPLQTTKYRKKVAVTRFHTPNSLQVEDITDIWNGYPLELLRRLGARGGVLPVNTTSSLLTSGNQTNPDAPANRDLIRRIAEQTGSQLVISGIILDAGSGVETLRPYAGWQGSENGRRFELGLPWPSLSAGIKPEASERRLDVEIFLHDGITGALVARHRHGALANGRVMVGRDKPFASTAFFATPFGQVLEQTLNSQVEALNSDLECLPFVANIVRIEGRKVFLDAGGTSALAPGDKLTVYHRNPSAPVGRFSPAAALGIPETPATTLTLIQVQPLFAVGDLAADPAKANVQVGDVVRFEAAGSKQIR